MIKNFNIGDQTVSAYMICALVGIFVAGIFAVKQTKEKKRDEFITVLLWSGAGVLIGGHLLYGLTNIGAIITAISSGRRFAEIAKYFGGSVFYGGLIGGLASAAIYCRCASISVSQYIDQGAIFIPLFHFFGRIGCFLSGCCFGVESRFGFVYHNSAIAIANGVKRFPVQLTEAICNLIIFVILYHFFRTSACRGRLMYMYFMFYSVVRFTMELFRGDAYRGFLLGLSTSQWISIVLFAVGLLMFIKKSYKDKRAEI